MPLSDDLLKPIAGANPAGADLRYDPLYDKIKEARREDDDAPQGEWERTRKVADWAQVVKLATEALTTRTKDLQIMAWLTEASIRREGFGGLSQGLVLLKGMTEQFWDQVYPEIEDGDTELRAAPLEWVGTRLDLPLKSVPLNKSGHDYLRYKESRTIPTEAEAEADDKKGEARRRAIEDRKVTPEEFDKGFAATPKPWYKQLSAEIKAGQAALQQLEALCVERFADSAPNFIPLRNNLEELDRTAGQLLARKLELEPDPVEASAAADTGYADAGGSPSAGGAAAAGGSGRALAAEPTDPADATNRVIGAARFLRQHDATSPSSYLLLRALRWGEVRAQGGNVDPRLLDAPSSQARTQLKTLMLDQDWPGLLEATESVMGTTAGRGWLDLQRYALNACNGMGPEFEFVTRAIRSELRLLLLDVPGLAEMALMDDLPTAGPSTLTWLKAEGFLAPAEEGQGGENSESSAPAPSSSGATGTKDRLLDRAMAEIKAGRPQKAIELIKRELDREQSKRGRFLRQVQLAKVMCEAGLDAAAIPLLEEMTTRIDEHRLEEWESGTLVAEPLALLHRCLARTGGDEAIRQALYLRIVKLDPVLALGFGHSGGNGEG
ncbi:MAG: type VI secretion system protein TssA [Gemmatimonadota bacterium]